MDTAAESAACTLFGEDGVGKCNAVIIVKKCVASFSLVGCLFMIGVIWLFRKYQLFVQRLILYMTIAALINSTAYLMTAVLKDGPLCNFEAFWLSFWDWAVLLWVACITLNLYLNAVKFIQTERFELLYHGVIWGISLLMACLPFIGDQYGPAGAWCWIKDDAQVWRFAIWYVPLFVIIFIMFIMYSIIIYSVKHKMNSWQGTYDPDISRNREMMKEYVKPLRAYPLIYLVLSIFPLINRIQNAANPSNPLFVLTLLQSVSSPLQGFVNSVVYGMDPETKSKLTWVQIKAALNKKSTHQPIREYPLVPAPETPDLEDVSILAMKPVHPRMMAWYKKTDQKPVIEPYNISGECSANDDDLTVSAKVTPGVEEGDNQVTNDPFKHIIQVDLHNEPALEETEKSES